MNHILITRARNLKGRKLQKEDCCELIYLIEKISKEEIFDFVIELSNNTDKIKSKVEKSVIDTLLHSLLDKIEKRAYIDKQSYQNFSIYCYEERVVIFIKEFISEKELLNALGLYIGEHPKNLRGSQNNKICFEYFNIKENGLGEVISCIVKKNLKNLKIEIMLKRAD